MHCGFVDLLVIVWWGFEFWGSDSSFIKAEVHNFLGQGLQHIILGLSRAEDKITFWTFESQVSKTENLSFN